MDKCPCCSEKPFDECCGPILEGVRVAETAEALMRSRYTAYTNGNIEYVKNTTHRTALDEFDEESARKWSKSSTWQGLEIVSTENGGHNDTEGVVEFVAHYLQDGKEERHHERSLFKKEGRKWFFMDGEIVGPKPFVRETPKVGRNAPCPCNSGKKYKKCCGKVTS
jgi:SEC-C motif domain protein